MDDDSRSDGAWVKSAVEIPYEFVPSENRPEPSKKFDDTDTYKLMDSLGLFCKCSPTKRSDSYLAKFIHGRE